MKAGFINYSNSHPFYQAICDKKLDGLEIVHDIPAQLNQKLHRGDLCLSAVSLFEYLKHEDDYWLMPNWCINSRGHVRSVLLYSKVPFLELNGKRVLLCRESATSNNLCRLLLNRHHIQPDKIELPSSNPITLDEWDALVLIGDPALNFKHADFNHITDLAEAWVEWTEGPVVFAVQALRKDQIAGHEQLISEIQSCHKEVQGQLKNNLQDVCKHVQEAYPHMETDFYDYFKCLDFHLDEACLKAIERYSLESKKIGTLHQQPHLQFAPI